MFTLPELPYPSDAFGSVISAEAFAYHHGQHHQTYVNNLNKLVTGTPFAQMGLEEVVLVSCGLDAAIFNNAAQVWNHTFYWMGLTPRGAAQPQGELLTKIQEKWGSFEAFMQAFIQSATGLFGSGWTWLVMTPAKELEIINTSNAQTPLASDNVPLLAVDVWEHAYYIDHRNRRLAYVTALFKNQMIDWEFVAKNYYQAK